MDLPSFLPSPPVSFHPRHIPTRDQCPLFLPSARKVEADSSNYPRRIAIGSFQNQPAIQLLVHHHQYRPCLLSGLHIRKDRPNFQLEHLIEYHPNDNPNTSPYHLFPTVRPHVAPLSPY